jgi:hypothetical protein
MKDDKTEIMGLRGKIIILGAGVLAAVAAIVVILLLAFGSSSSSSSSNTSTSVTTSPGQASSTPLKSTKSITAKINAKNSVATVINESTSLLNQAAALNTSSIEKSISKGNFGVLPIAFRSYFRFTGGLQNNKNVEETSYLTIISLAGSIKNDLTTLGKTTIAPIASDHPSKNVYVDTAVGNAFVPMGIYLGPSIGYSLEFVYVGGVWKFSPYSLVDEVYSVHLAISNSSASQPKAK